ncbi:HSP20-like chaperone [Durotheca rogersii]|uniref:HSP20-like chaperone n=1 Tax=Durotheca rogersii TaxID=419775 RepID=UPI00221F70BB|nr:HSP20-like chaperone [Durotheca rogersii]KAI5861791.1 HSP20-like chaperone [Durotheca rogersii]
MANTRPQPPFWEFTQSFGPNGPAQSFGPNHPSGAGIGVDHTNAGPPFPPGFPFQGAQFNPWTGYGWGHHGWHGWHGDRPDRDPQPSDKEKGKNDDDETESSPDTMRPTPDESVNGDAPPPPFSGAFPNRPPPPPHHDPNHHHPPPFGGPWSHPFGHHRGRGGRGDRGGRRGPHPEPPSFDSPFDMRPWMQTFANHPFAQAVKSFVDQAQSRASGAPGGSNEQNADSFTPPVDVFNTEAAYILHVSLPGATKEDVGMNWDGEKVNIAGVIYRSGTEEFLQSMVSSERTVGMFERSIKLPPAGDDEKEIDGLNITAKLENGVLVVTVPKTEKEWTQIHKVDIE